MLPFLLSLLLTQAEPPKATLDPTELPIPFHRYTTTDSLGRTITFYLSRVSDKNTKLPIILFIGGSGSQSHFSQRGDRIAGGIQNLLLQQVNKKARILCVEKPGVKFLDMPKQPGGASESSEEFRKEHTLPRWAAANIAALRAAWTVDGIDPAKTLVLGHSEGALTASFVAAELPQVTHVAPLAAAGPTQLFSLASLAAEPRPGDQPGDANKRREAVYTQWKTVLADPDSIDKYWMGHPHRRWTSFLKYNSVDLLKKSKAKIYLAHGTLDTSSHIGELDVLRAELAAIGREFVAERIDGVDHGYGKPNPPPGPPQGLQELFTRILAWFFDGAMATATEKPAIDTKLAARYFAEAERLWKEDNGKLWGKSSAGPILFADPKTRFAVANQADAEGNLKPDGSVFVGTLPSNIFIANYSRKWAGTQWVIIMWPLPADPHARGVLMMHECWHRIQSDIGLPLAGPNLNHLDQMQARYWLQLEWRALRIALLKTGSERKQAIEDALLFRRERHKLYAKEASAETALEMHEGMAEYTGTKLSGMSDGEQLLYAAKNLEQQPSQVGSFIRTFAYLSGPPYGLLLDAAGKTWRPDAKPTTNLGTLLADAYQINLPDLSADELEARAARYQGKELKAKEQERDAKRQKEIAQAKARYVDGPILILPLTKPQFSFTYANLIPLEGLGTVYPTITLSDQWGSLVANHGALMANDMKHARVSGPTNKADLTTGDGWKLKLNHGWTLVPGKRDGDYTVEQTTTPEKK